MKVVNKNSVSLAVSLKIKHLRFDKLYDYGIFNNIENRDALKNAISRCKKDERIVKVGRAKFYKQGKRDEIFEGNLVKARDRDILKRGKVRVDHYKFSKGLFWSNPHGVLPIENIVVKVLASESFSDISILRHSLGDNKIKEIFIEHFKINDHEVIRDYLNV